MSGHDQKTEFKFFPSSLLIAAVCLASSTLHAVAGDEQRPAEPSVSVKATSPGLPGRITTLDGKTYDKVTLEKVDPDGLLVRFAPVEGGSGSAKLKFRNLPPELRERFGYDPARASQYEIASAQGQANWLAESAAWTEQRRAALAEQTTWERQMRAQAETRRSAEAEQARVEAAYNVQEPSYYYSGWWWPNTYNSFQHHQREGVHHNQNHMHQQVQVGITSSPISPNIAPMRPGGR